MLSSISTCKQSSCSSDFTSWVLFYFVLLYAQSHCHCPVWRSHLFLPGLCQWCPCWPVWNPPLLPFQPIICLATRVIFSESNFGHGILIIWHPSDLGRKSKFLSIAEEVLSGPLSVCSSRMTFLRSPNLAFSKLYILMRIIQADGNVYELPCWRIPDAILSTYSAIPWRTYPPL